MQRPFRILALSLAIAATFAACGGDSKTVETKDGKITVDKDGKNAKVTINGENGGSATFGSQKLPDNFPSSVPTPKDVKLQSAISSEQNGEQVFQLIYSLDKASPADAVKDYRDRLDSDGFTIGDSATFGAGGASISGFEATKGDWTVVVSGIGGDKSDAILSVSVKKG